MTRLLPPKTKNRITIYKGITFGDILILVLALGIAILIYNSSLQKYLRYILSILILIISFSSVLNITGDRKAYYFFSIIFRYFLRKKSIEKVTTTQTGIQFNDNGIVSFKGQKSIYLQIEGIDFYIRPEKKQDYIINGISDAFKITNKIAISKIKKPIDYSAYVQKYLNEKIYWLNLAENGATEEERNIGEKRAKMLEQQIGALQYRQNVTPIMADTFYFQIYSSDDSDEELLETASKVKYIYNSYGIPAHILDTKEVKEYYRYFYNFTDEYSVTEEIEMPKIHEKVKSIYINDVQYAIVTFDRLPSTCVNAWTWQLYEIGAKVVCKASKTNTAKTIKAINRSIIEFEARYNEKGIMQSMSNTIEEQYIGLQDLLQQLQRGNQSLHMVNFYVLFPYDKLGKVEEIFAQNNIISDRLYFRQLEAYLDMQPYCIGQLKKTAQLSKNIQTNSLAAMFPYVFHAFMDTDGFYIGDSYYPVYWNFFSNLTGETPSRTNANTFIIGKSGNGKSFATKLMLKNLACSSNNETEDGKKAIKTRVFVLDPDNEYDYLSNNLGGEWIDLGSVSGTPSRINPFHVFPSLDNTSGGNSGELSATRQFLGQFFHIAAPDLDNEARSTLNKLIETAYYIKKIDEKTNYDELKAEDYPTMDTLYDLAYEAYCKSTHDYDRIIHKKILNTLEDFKTGGIYSRLWCGSTTLSLNSNAGFTVLNFQSLFANGNTKIANAQMLLVMRLLDVEIMRNKAINLATGSDNRIVIAIDEAHRFIDSKFPVALDFMSSKIKQIRKYNGMMLVTTQSVDDMYRADDSGDLGKKAGDIINGCQYTFMFGINAKDLNSVKKLYENYNGGLTENELDSLTNAERGDALVLVDANTRFNLHIYPMLPKEVEYIEKVNF